VFFENGRLGNQLFQYVALKELCPNQRIVFFGFGELKKALASVDAIVIEKDRLPCLLLIGLKLFLIGLARLRVIGTIKESRKNSNYAVQKVRGLVSVFLLKPSYFQHKIMIDTLDSSLRLSDVHFGEAADWLKEKIGKANHENLVFIHVRRGDYLTWPSREYPAVLGKQWYLNAMNQMREKIKNPIFVLLTDDPCYAKDCFGDQPDTVISENEPLVDLGLMSLCKHGILSASSFAWWGAWFSKTRNREPGIYMAPKYWGGASKG
ncbi:alpha-1,2-fucosyltransferase, partial [Litoricolaceae bacterium]|nr:alpha-1,2-fucosyltransferase [Litorivicinaceae bacterium]